MRWLLALALLLPSVVEAATFTCGSNGSANSCTVSGLNALIAGAADGDTITIANATHSMATGQVTINKRITIDGGGTCTSCGTNSASWSGGAVIDVGTHTLLIINVTAGTTTPVRITGIHFTGTPDFLYNWYDLTDDVQFGVVLSSNVADYRIDNNWFDASGTQSGMFLHTPGVIDHNIVQAAGIEGHMFFVTDSRNSTTDADGDQAWAETTVFGGGLSDRWVFFEDNTFIRPSGAVTFESSVVDCYAGGRYVFRHNYVRNGWTLNHDKSGGSNSRAGVAFEVYNNTFNFENAVGFQSAHYHRDGTLYYYNNSHVGFWQSYVKMWNRRADEAQGNWGLCNGAQVWDGNAGPGGRLCLDQVGTGASSGTTPATVQPQAALATRVWSNTGTVTGGCADTAQHSNKICNSNPTTIIDGTDYIFSDDATAAPGGYTAYTYPHPLVSGAEGGGSVTLGGMDLF